MDWTDARVVITGGAGGIGFALAQRAAQRGAHVRIVDIDAARAQQAAAKLGGGAKGYGCDVGQAEDMAALATSLLEDMGGIDVIFANAGVVVGGELERVSAADADWMISVNFLGIVNAARVFVPHLRSAARQGRDARFVITGSEHSLGIPSIGASNVYTGTKHGALGLADVMRSDLADCGVQVSLLCPGIVSTNIFDARANRSDRYGGAQLMAPDVVDQIKGFMDREGQAPELTAELCFEGLDRGDFIIITDPRIAGFARKRMAEIEAAIVLIEQRLSV